MKSKYKTAFLFGFILLLAASFRLFAINWDLGFHLHPDERAIVLSLVQIKVPESIVAFFSPASTWNPHFFAYGSLPFYILRIGGDVAGSLLHPSFAAYDRINLIGRIISAFFDIGTVILLFFLGRRLFSSTVGLLSSFFYSVSVLAMQLSHFYAVDTILTFFVTATLFALIRFYETPTVKKAFLIGICFAASLATKVSASVLIIAVGLTLAIDFLLLFLTKPHKPHTWFPHLPLFTKHLLRYGFIIIVTTLSAFVIFEPYALIDSASFWRQTIEQSHMTKSAFTFPYTLQYVGKVPYLYELKNIFFWGQGPILATLSFIGALYFTYLAITKRGKETDTYSSSEEQSDESRSNSSRLARTINSNPWAKELIVATFFWTYFLVVGNFAIGFMRYMLPIYPLLCLFAAVLIYRIGQSLTKHLKNKFILNTLYLILYTLLLVWPLSFMAIYTKPNTRVQASNWIYANIPPDNTLAVEHWDDQLPIGGTTQYKIETLALYDQDTPEKWQKINEQLARTDYLIIASNRLYTPLQKLTDCAKLFPHNCYTQTAEYYRRLFTGENVILNSFQDLRKIPNQVRNDNENEIRFTKIAEFTNYPTIPFFNIPINDQSADESFTVYDHPKVTIFKKLTTK